MKSFAEAVAKSIFHFLLFIVNFVKLKKKNQRNMKRLELVKGLKDIRNSVGSNIYVCLLVTKKKIKLIQINTTTSPLVEDDSEDLCLELKDTRRIGKKRLSYTNYIG